MATDTFDQNPYNLTADPLSGGGTYGEGRIGDALNRLRGLQSALQSGQIDYNTYQQLFNQLNPTANQTIQSITGSGSRGASAGNAAGATTYAGLSNLGGQDLSTFASIFKNLTGADPTGQDFTKYFANVPGILGSGPQSYADVNSALNAYIGNTYQPQIQANQKAQQTSALNDAQTQAQNLIGQQEKQTINQLTSPQTAEQLKEAYNSSGMLDSGAFSQGVANTLSNATANNISQALGAVTLPGISNIEGTSNAPYQSYLANLNPNLQTFGQNQTSYSNFNLQKDLADQIASMNSPSSFEKYSPLIQAAIQSGGSLGASALAGKSAICLELIKRGLASVGEVDALHWKILPAMFTRCRALNFYAKNGKKLVKAANDQSFDWSSVKSWFIDEPLSCETWQETVDTYAIACKKLAQLVAPELWEEGVMKPSFVDFFKFIIPVLMVPGYRVCYRDLFTRTFKELCHG